MITFDNRGVGRSRAFSHAYTTEAMADDAVSVLDAAGVDRAHVYGFSLGGMVAQQLALRHPERVRSLVLGATNPGGPRAVRADAEVIAFFRRRASMTRGGGGAGVGAVQLRPALPARARRPHRGGHLAQRLAHPFAERAYRAQMFAAALHNCYGRCRASTCRRSSCTAVRTASSRSPTRELLAERIPGARLRILEEAGHLYPTEEPEVDEAIARVPRGGGEGKR